MVEQEKQYAINSTWDCYVSMKKWMQNRNDGKSIGKYLEQYPYKTIAIYGAGDLGQLLMYEMKDSIIEVKYFIDKTAEGCRRCCEIPVILFEEIDKQVSVDAVIISPMMDYRSINEALARKGVMIPTLSLRDMIYEM